MQNDTLGEITAEEHQALRDNARNCARCGMLATVDPVLHASRYAHAPEYWSGQQLYRWGGSAFEVVADNRPTWRVRFLDGTSRDYRAASEQDARGQAQTGPSVHIVSAVKVELPYRIGHHAYAVTEDGRLLVYRPSMAGEVLADFPPRDSYPWPQDGGLALARDWARRTLEDHPLAVAVHISESHQMYPGTSWKQGPGVETVRRDETATPVPLPGFTRHDGHTARVVRPRQTREGQLPTWLIAAQCAAGTWVTWIVVRERGRLLFTCPRYFQRAEDDNQARAIAYLDELA